MHKHKHDDGWFNNYREVDSFLFHFFRRIPVNCHRVLTCPLVVLPSNCSFLSKYQRECSKTVDRILFIVMILSFWEEPLENKNNKGLWVVTNGCVTFFEIDINLKVKNLEL